MPRKPMGTDRSVVIGDVVMVRATTKMGYKDDRHRIPITKETKPFQATVIGAIRRPKGTIIQDNEGDGTVGSGYISGFRPTGYVCLYQLRKKFDGPIIEALPDGFSLVRAVQSNTAASNDLLPPAAEKVKRGKTCPSCGYTKDDCWLHGDHRLCPKYPFFAFEKKLEEARRA